MQSHRCFVQVAPPPPQDDIASAPFHVFFDIESRQEDGQHIPNLVVAETEVEEEPFRFQGETCLQQFTTWLDYLAEETARPLTVLAHNFQGYDSYPLVEEYHRQKRLLEQTRNGAKILQLLPVVLSNALVGLSQDLWPDRTEERVFPPPLQYPGQPRLRGAPATPGGLLARQHERPGPPGFRTLVR